MLTHGTCDAQAAIWDGVELGHLAVHLKAMPDGDAEQHVIMPRTWRYTCTRR